MGTKYDYIALKQEYVQNAGLSIRELCRNHDIASFSAVAKRARDEDWDGKRAEFQRQLEDKSLSAIADKVATKRAQIQLDSLQVIHAGILKMAEDMDDREPIMDGDKVLRDGEGNIVWRKAVRYGPAQMATMIDKFLALTGQPSQVTENRNLNLSGEADHDTMREILDRLRHREPALGPAGAAEGSDPKRVGPN